jgi:hypothetical protein
LEVGGKSFGFKQMCTSINVLQYFIVMPTDVVVVREKRTMQTGVWLGDLKEMGFLIRRYRWEDTIKIDL